MLSDLGSAILSILISRKTETSRYIERQIDTNMENVDAQVPQGAARCALWFQDGY